MGLNCLLEIGVEELPASYVAPAMEQLRRDVDEGLSARGLSHGLCLALATPRRLALFLSNLPPAQPDRAERALGPPESRAYDAKGLPTRAAQGFAAKQGVDVGDLRVETTGRGRYLAVEKTIRGRPTGELLIELFGEAIPQIGFPKTMIWGRGPLRFARPIRWLVTLLGKEILPLNLEGLVAGRRTQGHRFFNGRADVDLERADLDHYREMLRRHHVLVDPLERREVVREQVGSALGDGGKGKPVIQEGLVDIVANLVEWPTAMVGTFDEVFLEVPKEVLETAMVHHQRYFPVEDASGRPLNEFVFVSNGPSDHAATIIAGNERVLRARLADAQFFYREDRRKSVEEHAAELKSVTWQERLGSYAEKAARLKTLAEWVGAELGLGKEVVARLAKAACLCKADLVTGMVGEFPELQGVMGRIYFAAQGGEAEVAQALEEHHWPRGAGGDLPRTDTGALLSSIDKIDSIVGCFRVGLAPSGSQDPYALRRQALGVVRTLRGREAWTLPLGGLVAAASAGFGDQGEPCEAEATEFIRARLRNLLTEEGHRPEVVDAIFVTSDDEVRSLVAKVEALSRIVDQPDFREIATAAKRVLNILRQAETKFMLRDFRRPEGGEPTEEAERALAESLPRIQREVAACWAKGDHLGAFRCLATLRPQVDAFFDTVRVMDQDTAKRDFRLALLSEFRSLFLDIADISRIAVEKNS